MRSRFIRLFVRIFRVFHAIFIDSHRRMLNRPITNSMWTFLCVPLDYRANAWYESQSGPVRSLKSPVEFVIWPFAVGKCASVGNFDTFKNHFCAHCFVLLWDDSLGRSNILKKNYMQWLTVQRVDFLAERYDVSWSELISIQYASFLIIIKSRVYSIFIHLFKKIRRKQ